MVPSWKPRFVRQFRVPLYFDLIVQRYSPLIHAILGEEHSTAPSTTNIESIDH